jgi:hypothetical protein
MEILIAQVVFTALLVFGGWILRGLRHPADGKTIVAWYPHRLLSRLVHAVVLAALVLGAIGLGVLAFVDDGTPGMRLGLLDALAFDFLCIQTVRGSARRSYVAVTADGIFRPSRLVVLWRDVEEAWWNGAVLTVRLPPDAAAARIVRLTASLRNPVVPMPVPDTLVGVDGWMYRISADDYTALRDALPPEVRAKMREWRFGTGHAPPHHHLPPPPAHPTS